MSCDINKRIKATWCHYIKKEFVTIIVSSAAKKQPLVISIWPAKFLILTYLTAIFCKLICFYTNDPFHFFHLYIFGSSLHRSLTRWFCWTYLSHALAKSNHHRCHARSTTYILCFKFTHRWICLRSKPCDCFSRPSMVHFTLATVIFSVDSESVLQIVPRIIFFPKV